MRKKGISIFVICALIATMFFSLTGCAKGNSICSLEKAYETGIITKADLDNIAFFFNEGENAIAPSREKDPPTLSEKSEKLIISDFKKYIKKNFSYTPKDVWVTGYFGTYNECVAVTIVYYGQSVDDGIPDCTIDGVVFYDYHEMFIWTQGI